MDLLTIENIKVLLLVSFAVLSFPILKAMRGAPFVPTPRKTMEKMLEEIDVKPGHILYDLGCGDGRFVRLAARKYGAKAIGIELNPLVYLYAKLKSFGKKNEKIICKDFRKVNLSDADVIVCYLLTNTMKEIENKLETELKTGAKVVSHGFKFKDWEVYQTILTKIRGSGSIHFYEKK